MYPRPSYRTDFETFRTNSYKQHELRYEQQIQIKITIFLKFGGGAGVTYVMYSGPDLRTAGARVCKRKIYVGRIVGQRRVARNRRGFG